MTERHDATHWFDIPVADVGFIAQVIDCEGKRIGLHSPTA
jgi:predicted enzyme related to lactoylglutathione lyase